MVCSATMAGSRTQHPFSEPPTVVLYHAECADGFGAAWAIWNRFPAARFIPVKHGNPPPAELQDQRVVIVDFSYARETLETMAAQTQALLVLDHHITAEKALAGLPYAYFDMKNLEPSWPGNGPTISRHRGSSTISKTKTSGLGHSLPVGKLMQPLPPIHSIIISGVISSKRNWSRKAEPFCVMKTRS